MRTSTRLILLLTVWVILLAPMNFPAWADSAVPLVLINKLKIVSDLGDSPLEFYEDDHDSLTMNVENLEPFLNKQDIRDTIVNGSYRRYGATRSLVDGLILPFPKILVNGPNTELFIQNHIDLLRGHIQVCDAEGNFLYDLANKKVNLPFTLTGLTVPITLKLGLRTKSANWGYIDTDLDLNPYIVSTCFHDKRCLSGAVPTYTQPADRCCWIQKTKKTRPKGDTNGDGIEDGNDEQEDYDVIDGPRHCLSKEIATNHDTLQGHVVISAVESLIKNGATTSNNDVTYYHAFHIEIKDRTPPHICDADGNEPFTDRLPELWGAGSTVGVCTTGDYNRVEEISLKDNYSSRVTSRFAVGMRNESGDDDDAKFVWAGDSLETNSSAKVNYIFVPNECKGTMKYCIFAWDQVGNVNPGVPKIAEDQPSSSYGLGSPFPNLKPGGGFPVRFVESYSGPMDGSSSEYSADRLLWALKERKLPAKLGDISITDNDRPNLLIRIESVKDKGSLDKYARSFPPPSETITTADPDYSQLLAGTNSQEDFIGLKGGEKLAVVPLPFKYLSDKTTLSSSADTTAESVASLNKFRTSATLPSVLIKDGIVSKDSSGKSLAVTSETTEDDGVAIDTNFTAMNFRLESYSTSDTDITGDPITNDEKTYGERNGFGREAMLISKEPLTEDVEYLVWIWAEDNVKWSSIAGERVSKSGIKQCKVTVNDPNQNPPLLIEKEIDDLEPQTEDPTEKELDRFRHGPFRLICREPTRDFSLETLNGHSNPHQFLEDNKVPCVDVQVKDYSGNVRALRVYFQVSDVKAKVRIIEQKHIRN